MVVAFLTWSRTTKCGSLALLVVLIQPWAALCLPAFQMFVTPSFAVAAFSQPVRDGSARFWWWPLALNVVGAVFLLDVQHEVGAGLVDVDRPA